MKTLILALALAIASPSLALRSPVPNPGPVARQTWWSADLISAPPGLYVKSFDVSGDGPTLYHFSGGGVYVLGPNGSMSPFVASEWDGVLWVKGGGEL